MTAKMLNRTKQPNLISAPSWWKSRLAHWNLIWLRRKNLREILQDNSGWLERNVRVRLGVLDPVKDLLDIRGLDVELVAVPNCGLKKHSDGVWKGLYCQIQEVKRSESSRTYRVWSRPEMGACRKHCLPSRSSRRRMDFSGGQRRRLGRFSLKRVGFFLSC